MYARAASCRPLAQPYMGPYKVVEKNPKYFRLDIGGKQTAVTVDRLKPHTGGAAATLAPRPLTTPAQDVLNPSTKLPQTHHGLLHHLRTSGPPIASAFRMLDAEKLKAAQAEFAELERTGIVRRSDSPWASPLHMVRKADCMGIPFFRGISIT